jgi:hypothetical protein
MPPKAFRFTHFPKNTSASPLESHTFKTKDLKPFRFIHFQKSGGGGLCPTSNLLPPLFAKPFNINTYEICVCNSFNINTYKKGGEGEGRGPGPGARQKQCGRVSNFAFRVSAFARPPVQSRAIHASPDSCRDESPVTQSGVTTHGSARGYARFRLSTVNCQPVCATAG